VRRVHFHLAFVGASYEFRSERPFALKILPPDLDDTLVLTSDADLKAYECVAALALELCPGVDTERLISAWKLLFLQTPWDPEGKVTDSCLAYMLGCIPAVANDHL
jgi:hypothetical protein